MIERQSHNSSNMYYTCSSTYYRNCPVVDMLKKIQPQRKGQIVVVLLLNPKNECNKLIYALSPHKDHHATIARYIAS